MKTGLTILVVILLCGLFLQLPIAANEEIKVGAMYSVTGYTANYADPARKGSALAVKEINEAGGILGKKVTLIVEDGKSEHDAIANATERLISYHNVDFLIGTVEATHTMIVGGIAQENKMLFIDVCGTATYIPEVCGDYTFMAVFTDDVQAAASAKYCYEKLGARTAWLFIDTAQDYCVNLGESFEKHFTNLGGKTLLKDSYVTGDVDFRGQITRMRSLNPQPDILFIPADSSTGGLIVKQIREMGIDLPIVSGDGFDTPVLVETAGKEYSNNVIFTTHVFFGSDAPIVRNFVEAYKKEYNMEPENCAAATGYDTVYLLADAIKRAGSTDMEAVRASLGETKDFPMVTGSLSYLNGQRFGTKEVSILKLVDGKQVLLELVKP